MVKGYAISIVRTFPSYVVVLCIIVIVDFGLKEEDIQLKLVKATWKLKTANA